MKDMELDLNILENADDSEIKRIAEFNSVPDSAKERMFRISRDKFIQRTENNAKTETIAVSGVEQYKKPIWHKIIAAAAALVLTAGAVSGGALLIRNRKNIHTISTENETTLPTEGSTVTEATTEAVTTISTDSVNVSEKENEPISFYDPITDSIIECDPSRFFFHLYNSKDDTNMFFNNKNNARWLKFMDSFNFEELPSDYDITNFLMNYNGIILDISYLPSSEPNDPQYINIFENGIVSISKDNENIYYYKTGEENARKLIDMADNELKNICDNLSPDRFFKRYTPVSADISCPYTDYESHTISDDDLASFVKLLTALNCEYTQTECPFIDEPDKHPNFELNVELLEDEYKMYHIWFYDNDTIYCLYSSNAVRRYYKIPHELYEAGKELYDKYYTR